MLIFSIFFNAILPIILLVIVGMLLHRKFSFDLQTLSKLLLYYYIPALAFVHVYEANISSWILLQVISFLVSLALIMIIFAKLSSYLFHHPKLLKASFTNSVISVNSGNVGIPLNQFVFHSDPLAMAIQMITVLFEVFISNTYCLLQVNSATKTLKQSLVTFLHMPVSYALALGLLCNFYQVKIPDFLLVPLKTVAEGLLALALVSLGAQFTFSKWKEQISTVLLSNSIRLCIAPLCAYFLLMLLNLSGTVAQVLFIASSLPSSRHSATLALAYNNEPQFAAQAVLFSSLWSCFTLSIIIYLAKVLF